MNKLIISLFLAALLGSTAAFAADSTQANAAAPLETISNTPATEQHKDCPAHKREKKCDHKNNHKECDHKCDHKKCAPKNGEPCPYQKNEKHHNKQHEKCEHRHPG